MKDVRPEGKLRLALAAAIAVGLVVHLALGDPRLGLSGLTGLPRITMDLPRVIGVLASVALVLFSAWLSGRRKDTGDGTKSQQERVQEQQEQQERNSIAVSTLILAATLCLAMLTSGPNVSQHLSLALSHPATLSVTRTLLHAFLLVTLVSIGINICIRPLLSGTRTAAPDFGSRLLAGALVASVALQVSLGVALRHHPVLLWPHILVALTAVMPLAMRVSLLSLLEPEQEPQHQRGDERTHGLAIALLTTLTVQIGLGISAYAVPSHVQIGRGNASFDFMVTLVHFLVAMLLLALSIAHGRSQLSGSAAGDSMSG